MSQHTPGPWHVEIEPVKNFGKRYVAELYGRLKASPLGRFLIISDTDVSIENAEADARLIAAAPELLAACNDMDSALYAIRKDLGMQYPALSEAWINMCAAIAKAEGGEG